MYIDEYTWVQSILERDPAIEAVLGELGIPLDARATQVMLYELCDAHQLDLGQVCRRLRDEVSDNLFPEEFSFEVLPWCLAPRRRARAGAR